MEYYYFEFPGALDFLFWEGWRRRGGRPVWIEPFQGPGHTWGREDGLRGSVTLMVSVMHRLGSAGLPGSPPAGQQGLCFSPCRRWIATDPLPAPAQGLS